MTSEIQDEDESYNTGVQAQCDLGWGKRLAGNTGIFAGLKVPFPWFKTAQLDLYAQGPSSKHVLWGLGFEVGAYVAGPYASLTFDTADTGYVTFTGRIQAPVQDAWHTLYGGQLAFGIQSFVLFVGYSQDQESDRILLVGAGFVPDWKYRGGAPPPQKD